MNTQQMAVIDGIRKEVALLFENEFSGHDMLHTQRVLKNAENICRVHGGDIYIITLAALLHDADDKKLSPDTYKDNLNARRLLGKYPVSVSDTEKIIEAVRSVSFSSGESAQSLEAKIVQDADRLDALGAVGIARCFAYSGVYGRAIYNEDDTKDGNVGQSDSGIAHFYQKLLKLEGLMQTAEGKKEAEKRTAFLKIYLLHFAEETGLEIPDFDLF